MAIVIDSFDTDKQAKKALQKMPHVNPGCGCIAVKKNGSTGKFMIVQFPVNKPGADVSCVDCGAAHVHDRCPKGMF